MADRKISELPAAALPLTGTELVALVQGGETDRVPVSGLRGFPAAQVAGRQILPLGEAEGQFATIQPNRAFFAPFMLDLTAVVNAITVRGTATAAPSGQQFDLAIYRCSPDRLQPIGAPIFTSGAINNNVQNTNITAAISPSLTMDPGVYFIAYNANIAQNCINRANRNAAKPIMSRFAIVGTSANDIANGAYACTRWTATTFGTWPTFTGQSSENASFTQDTNETVPAFALRTV